MSKTILVKDDRVRMTPLAIERKLDHANGIRIGFVAANPWIKGRSISIRLEGKIRPQYYAKEFWEPFFE